MAKKQNATVGTVVDPKNKAIGSRQVEYQVVDGKIVEDTNPGVVQ